MLQKEVVIGKHYLIRHNGQLSVVLLNREMVRGGFRQREVTHYLCTKLSTGREIEVKSASKFKFEVVMGLDGKWSRVREAA